jgi:hypothetical protein
MLRRRIALALLLATVGCGGTDDPSGLGEPLVVQQADFKEGALPGSSAAAGVPAALPRITSLAAGFGVLQPGTRGATLSGRTSMDAHAVGVRFAGQGSGYWVRSVGGEDPLLPGELSFGLSFDAASAIEPGMHDLELVAFDGAGKAGEKQVLRLCVASQLPDNLNVCDAKNAPPLVVASLEWNSDADLDLTVVAPDGSTYDRSKRSRSVDGRVVARLDHDGTSGCLADGRRNEHFVFLEPPASGNWNLYVDAFDACGKAAVHYVLRIHQRIVLPDGTFELRELSDQTVRGQLVRAQANGGAAAPIYLTKITF